VGEFLVLVGSFAEFPRATAIATSGVIFAAAYLLWALQRMLFGPVDKRENEDLPDLSRRELAVLTPLIICILWIGLYPAPFLRRVEASAEAVISQVKNQAASDVQAARPAALVEPGEDD
jgi:NADH-quinone oxidoreductase subunit M